MTSTEEIILAAVNSTDTQKEIALKVLRGESISRIEAVEEEILTPQELSQKLSISLVTLWRLNLPFVRVGSAKRYLLSEVMAFLGRT